MTTATEAVIGEVADDALYVVMRAARLVIGLVCEVGFLAAFIGPFRIGATWLFYHSQYRPEDATWWLPYISLAHPVLAIAACPVLFAIFFGLYVTVVTPYRYQTGKPGLKIRTCGTCGTTVPDRWMCGNCGEFRWSKLASTAIYLVSLPISLFGHIHDKGLIALLAIATFI